MSFLNADEVCLFSSISAVITLNGEPVPNATLTRTLQLSEEKSDQTTTNDSGFFELPPIVERTVTKFLPQEIAVKQDLIKCRTAFGFTLLGQGKEIGQWRFSELGSASRSVYNSFYPSY